MSENQLKEIDNNAFGNLSNLIGLNLSKNQLNKFDANRLLKNCKNLGAVILFNNNLDPSILSYYNKRSFDEEVKDYYLKLFKDYNQTYLNSMRIFLKQFN